MKAEALPLSIPASEEAEQSVLGALLHDNSALERVRPLCANDFFARQHRLIFAAIEAQVSAGRPADEITTLEHLKSIGAADESGGLAYLSALTTSVPGASHVVRYAEIVREFALRRQLLEAADVIAGGARSAVTPIVALNQARELIEKIRTANASFPSAQPRTVRFAELARRQAPARHWFRPGWLGPDPTVLSGGGGIGKSGLSQHEATAGALGRPYVAEGGHPYKSLVWNCEDEHDDLWRRQERICEHEQVDMAELEDRLLLVSRYGCDNALMATVQGTLAPTRLLEQLRQQVNDEGVDVLWLDNVAHFLQGDHDDRSDVTAFINALKGLVCGRPFGVTMLAHISRAAGSEYTGSVAWENAARMRWYLGSRLPDQRPVEGDEQENSNIRFLAKRKSNYSARDYIRFTMQDGLLVPDQPSSHVAGVVSAMDERRAEDVCLAGFRSLASLGVRTTDGKTTADYLPTQILEKGLAAGFTKFDLGRAMNRLMGKKVFVRGVIGKHTNRSDKYGLVLNEGGA